MKIANQTSRKEYLIRKNEFKRKIEEFNNEFSQTLKFEPLKFEDYDNLFPSIAEIRETPIYSLEIDEIEYLNLDLFHRGMEFFKGDEFILSIPSTNKTHVAVKIDDFEGFINSFRQLLEFSKYGVTVLKSDSSASMHFQITRKHYGVIGQHVQPMACSLILTGVSLIRNMLN